MEDRRWYQLTHRLEEEFDNINKPLIVQLAVRNEQNIDCGGGSFPLQFLRLDRFSSGVLFKLVSEPNLNQTMWRGRDYVLVLSDFFLKMQSFVDFFLF